MVSLDQFRATFLTECTELLSDMEERLISLTPESADSEQLNAIFRCAHSIKGGSGAFGLDYITHFTHALEALLDAMREGRIAPTREAVDALLASKDIVSQMVAIAIEGSTPPEGLGASVLQQLQRLIGTDTGSSATTSTTNATASPSPEASGWHITFTPLESLLHSGNEPLLVLRELSQLGTCHITCHHANVPNLAMLDPLHCHLRWEVDLHTTVAESTIREVFEFVESHCALTIAPRSNGPGEATAPPAHASPSLMQNTPTAPKPSTEEQAGKTPTTTSIRVDLEKVDRLVNMVGELVITEAMLKAQSRHLAPEAFAGLLRGIDELSQHTRELQEAVMAVRMQPVKSIFSRMPRIVRDLSAQLGKDITLETSGENTEVDKTVIEQLGDPLTHMIRNSADHGIETPDMRMAAGKPAQGTIRLSAMHQGGRIIIEITDDGAGINRARVLAKAREKGLIAPDAQLTDDEADNLIFMAGFSTAETVSNVSGRGVGMDVVRRNIENLSGTVRVANTPGAGARFTVSLPLTLAILDGMIVRVGAEHYIIPITNIIETLRPRPDEVRHVEGTHDVINVRGEFIPILYLHHIFRIHGATTNPSHALVVLVEAGHSKLGIVVDELIGQQQVVIKSLETNTDPVAGISGATILGDGRVSLILEISQLKQLAASQSPFHAHPLAA